MKLALIRRQFSATGGAELYLQRLLGALVQRGHEPHLYAEAWNEQPDGAVFHRIPVTGSRAQRPVRFAAAVQTILAKEKFDCVFSLERTLKQDVYRAGDGVHRAWLERRRQFTPWWKKPLIGLGKFHRNMLALEAQTFDPANTRRIIVNSEMVKREILEHFKFPAERTHLVRNGVEVARFQSGRRAETRARFGVKDDEFLLLFVGSGWERKGLNYLLQARQLFQPGTLATLAAGMKQGVAEFRRAGSNVQNELVRALSGATGESEASTHQSSRPAKVKLLVVGKGRPPAHVSERVIFAGSMPDVENAYAAADLFVFLPIYEPSANVVFEAMAAGLPVITSAYNGAGELIENGANGTVINNPADTLALDQAISFWWTKRFGTPPVDETSLSLNRNVSETIAVLELAAREKSK